MSLALKRSNCSGYSLPFSDESSQMIPGIPDVFFIPTWSCERHLLKLPKKKHKRPPEIRDESATQHPPGGILLKKEAT